MKRSLILFSILLAVIFLIANASPRHMVGNWQSPPDDPLSHGGRLYDKWWAELNFPKPQETHPSYPEIGAKSGANTWRCKECHGWDYQGKNGAYSKGSHFTGIKGIRDFKGGNSEEIIRILKDQNHQYETLLPPEAFIALADFVVNGQIDMEQFIDLQTGNVFGADPRLGRDLFNDKCARCHDEDGRYQNFSGDEKNPEFVGTVAKKNPWETWHKIRNGHPGSRMPMGPGMMGRWMHGEGMPTFRSLSLAEQVSILAYAQTLPVE